MKDIETIRVHAMPASGHGANACLLALDAAQTWWRYCNASPTRGARRFAAFAWHALRSPRAQWRWLQTLDRDESTRQALINDPSLLARWHRPFVATSFGVRARQQLLEAHLVFVASRFPARLRDKVLLGHDLRLATLPLRDGDVAYLHVRKPIEPGTGELGLYLLDSAKHVLASCALTLGEKGALIGELRGAWSFMGKDAIHRFTRESHGTRPKDLLLCVVRSLARHYGWTYLRATSARAQVSVGTRDAERYDAYWLAHGGVLATDGMFDLPCHAAERAAHAWPSRRRAARRRKLQFREDVCRLVLRNFDGPYQTLVSPQAQPSQPANLDAVSSEAWWPALVRSRL